MGEAFRWAGGGAQHPLQRQGLSGERNHSRPHPLRLGSLHPSRDIQEVLTSERVARILADYAIEVRKLAYILPGGLAESEALRIYEEMAHDADLWLRRSPAARSHLQSVPRPSDHPAI